MRVYISGPMRGYADDNYPAFNEAAARWRAAGTHVCNPAENFHGDRTLPMTTYMHEDILQVICCDSIAMLPGWEKSVGARKELLVAQAIGLEIFDATTMKPFDPPTVRTTLEPEARPLFIDWSGMRCIQ